MDLQKKTGIERKQFGGDQSLPEPEVKDPELLDASIFSAVQCSLTCHALSKTQELWDHLIKHNLLARFFLQNVTSLNAF